MKTLDDYEHKLLTDWEEVHKKSQLTLWILLALKDAPKHMSQIKQFVAEVYGPALIADNQSMYRALRRFKEAQLISFTLRAGQKGPDLKQYYLTAKGRAVLEQFLKRNIIKVFYTKKVRNLIKGEI